MKRRVVVAISCAALLATIIPASVAADPQTSIWVGQGASAYALWRSGPFAYEGHPAAYREVSVSVVDQVVRGAYGTGPMRCVDYSDKIYEIDPVGGGHIGIKTTATFPCAAADVRFTPSLDAVGLATTQVPVTTYVEGQWPPTSGTVQIGLSMVEAGPWAPEHNQQTCGGDHWCANNVDRIRPADAAVSIDGTAMPEPTEAFISHYTSLAR